MERYREGSDTNEELRRMGLDQDWVLSELLKEVGKQIFALVYVVAQCLGRQGGDDDSDVVLLKFLFEPAEMVISNCFEDSTCVRFRSSKRPFRSNRLHRSL